jgi:hypothetical protein
LLDQQKLKDIFLPTVEISGKGGYLNATARFISPEIAIPAIKPIFPGAVFPEGTFNNNFTLSSFEAAGKAEAKVLFFWRKSKISKTSFNREKQCQSSFAS